MPERFRFPLHGEPVEPAFIALLEKLEQQSILLDSRYCIPGTQIRFGLDPLIGILPIAGDVASAAWSLQLLTIARKLGAPAPLLRQMMLIITVDFLVGLVPVVGPVADIFYRANMKNLTLLLNAIGAARATVAPG